MSAHKPSEVLQWKFPDNLLNRLPADAILTSPTTLQRNATVAKQETFEYAESFQVNAE